MIGGLAASVLGRPRVTHDIDVLAALDEDAWDGFVRRGSEWGFIPRIPDCVAFARKSRVLLVHHEPTTIDVDIVCAGLPFEQEVIDRARPCDVGGMQIHFPIPEDLIVMKAVAGRTRDLSDIEAVCDANPEIDWNHVCHWTRQFADALDMPEIVEIVESFRDRRE